MSVCRMVWNSWTRKMKSIDRMCCVRECYSSFSSFAIFHMSNEAPNPNGRIARSVQIRFERRKESRREFRVGCDRNTIDDYLSKQNCRHKKRKESKIKTKRKASNTRNYIKFIPAERHHFLLLWFGSFSRIFIIFTKRKKNDARTHRRTFADARTNTMNDTLHNILVCAFDSFYRLRLFIYMNIFFRFTFLYIYTRHAQFQVHHARSRVHACR